MASILFYLLSPSLSFLCLSTPKTHPCTHCKCNMIKNEVFCPFLPPRIKSHDLGTFFKSPAPLFSPLELQQQVQPTKKWQSLPDHRNLEQERSGHAAKKDFHPLTWACIFTYCGNKKYIYLEVLKYYLARKYMFLRCLCSQSFFSKQIKFFWRESFSIFTKKSG
jgi:hypothetical protein